MLTACVALSWTRGNATWIYWAPNNPVYISCTPLLARSHVSSPLLLWLWLSRLCPNPCPIYRRHQLIQLAIQGTTNVPPTSTFLTDQCNITELESHCRPAGPRIESPSRRPRVRVSRVIYISRKISSVSKQGFG